jgi:ABC-type lipoprotein export system ATPase subunit
MIELKNVERSYQTGPTETWVLRRIGITIREGEFVTVMGPSGAGKSSLLNILALLDDGWKGEYWFGETAAHKLNRKQRADLARQRIGMVFQSYHLLDDLTVAENIDLPLSYKNLPAKERQGMVADILDRFQIVAKKDLFPFAALRRAAATGGHCARRGSRARAAAGRRANRQPALHAGSRDHESLLRTQPRGHDDCAGDAFG